MRIVFMGTPEFSVPVLEALARDHEVICVYSQPPRPAGRGKKDRPSPVQARAEALGLPVRHPVSLRSPEAQAEFAALNADVAVVVAYGLILPQAVLDAPRHGCLNIHASLLPRWRGAAPIHRAIMAGDAQTGICIMQMEAGLDTGPVLLREATAIGPEETTGALHDRLSAMGARLIGEYDSEVAAGQTRVLLAWDRLILPDGRSIVLERQPGTDGAGFAGLQDRVNQHWGNLLKAAAVSTLLGVGAELGADSEDDLTRALRRGSQDTINQTGQQIVRRQLNVPPTLTIRPGHPLRVVLTRDLVLEPIGVTR